MRFCDWLIRNKDIYRESVFNDHLSLLQKVELLGDYVYDTRIKMKTYDVDFTTTSGVVRIPISKDFDKTKPITIITNIVGPQGNNYIMNKICTLPSVNTDGNKSTQILLRNVGLENNVFNVFDVAEFIYDYSDNMLVYPKSMVGKKYTITVIQESYK